MAAFDLRQFLPGLQQAADQGVDMLWRPNGNFAPTPDPFQMMQQVGAENPGTTFWATGGGPSGPGTFSVPVQPSGAPQQQPPPPVGTPKQPEVLTDTNDERRVTQAPITGKVPEITVGTRDERTVPPPATPPTSRKVPEVLTPIAGPDNKPARDERLVPTPASQTPAAAAGNDWDRVMKLMKDPKMGGAIAALAKMGGSSKGPAPPAPWHSTLQGGNPGYHPGNPGGAAQMLEGVMKPKHALGRKRKERQDDPLQFEQDTYDFRRLRGGR